jgi:predicted DNA-binding ribbon-helix-helix protein
MFALLHSLSERRGSNLSSAIRVFVLEHYIDARHRQMLPVKEESDHTSLPRLLPRLGAARAWSLCEHWSHAAVSMTDHGRDVFPARDADGG